jgi:hypothetical protein
MRRAPLHRWLAVIPGLLILVGVPFANRVHGLLLGMPFLLVWIVGSVVLTSPIMALVGALDAKHAARSPGSPPPAGAGERGSGR